jgi:NAD(P)-dependent dehydrogenase (short-subunit alcohol dehydrogenase family)
MEITPRGRANRPVLAAIAHYRHPTEMFDQFANAGIQAFKPILDWQDADWQDTNDVNLTGTCNAVRAVAPHLVKNGGGRIIVTSSTQGRHGTKFGAAYSASK